jgi:hypothetical protein
MNERIASFAECHASKVKRSTKKNGGRQQENGGAHAVSNALRFSRVRS